MDAVHDPQHKRPTSINQLLNPIGVSPAPSHGQYSEGQNSQPYAHGYGPGSAYGLRRATWDASSGLDARAPEPSQRMYQPQVAPMNGASPEAYGGMHKAEEPPPPRATSGQYDHAQMVERHAWSNGGQSMSYGAPAAYSDQRPGSGER